MIAPALANLGTAARLCVLLALCAAFVGLFETAHLPAALLLGSMGAAIVLAALDAPVKIAPAPYLFAQGVLGCLIAHTVTLPILHEMAMRWPLFACFVAAVIVLATGLGLVLTRFNVLPGTTAIWGSSPGAASVMMLMAESYGGDIRLVAFMQYLRVVFIAIVASVIARFVTPVHGVAPAPPFFATFDSVAVAKTMLLAGCGAWVGRAIRLPAGSLLVPLFGGIALSTSGLLTIVLPPWLLAAAYLALGFSIGSRFTREILGYARKAFLRVAASTLALIALCGGLAYALHRLTGLDLMSAYLATSPGGADSAAIIGSSLQVDLPFIMAMQLSRVFVLLFLGPYIARAVVRFAGIQAFVPPEG